VRSVARKRPNSFSTVPSSRMKMRRGHKEKFDLVRVYLSKSRGVWAKGLSWSQVQRLTARCPVKTTVCSSLSMCTRSFCALPGGAAGGVPGRKTASLRPGYGHGNQPGCAPTQQPHGRAGSSGIAATGWIGHTLAADSYNDDRTTA
jgi:hypothetical protein